MPSPNTTTFQRPDLGQAFEEFDLAAARAGHIGLRILPVFNTPRQTASFSRVTVESLLREGVTARASGGHYNRQDYQFEQDSFATEEHGAEEIIDDRERNIYAYTLDFERISSGRAMGILMRNREVRIAALAFSTSVFTGALTGAVGTPWSSGAAATPIGDVKSGIEAFKGNTGMLPNVLVINDDTFRVLTQCDEIIDRIKYNGGDDPKVITKRMLAALFDVEEVIVAEGMRNSADQGQAVTFANIWSSTRALLARVARTQDLREPCLGRTFHFTGDGSSEGGTVEMYRDESRRSDVIRVRQDTQEKVIYANMGYLLTGVNT